MLEQRVQHLDGLRGLCCLWIMFYHLGVMLDLKSLVNTGWFDRGMVPVYLFFILSGFVIAGLLREKQESFRQYLFRRFFRIWPMFVLLSVVGALLVGFELDVLAQLNDERKAIRQHVEIYQASRDQWSWHLLAHISMLHGLFDDVLPWSSKSFIPPGWTITVEWQFYLLAPLMVASFRYGLVIIVWAAFYALRVMYGTQSEGTYLYEYADAFLLGIASYLLVTYCQQRYSWQLLVMLIVAATFFCYQITDNQGPAFAGDIASFLWLLFLAAVYFPVAAIRGWAGRCFDNRLLVFYGEISYSLYLVHMLVIFAVLSLTLPWRHGVDALLFYGLNALLLGLVATLIATFLYRYGELPAMAWASRQVRSWKKLSSNL